MGTGSRFVMLFFMFLLLILCYRFLFHSLKMAGWTTYDSTTAEIMPTRVAKPTDLMAGWLATSMDATVTMRMKAEKKMAVLWYASTEVPFS